METEKVPCKLCKVMLLPDEIEDQGMCAHCWDIATDDPTE